MLASLQDILDTVKSNTLTYQQKLMCLGNIASDYLILVNY